MNNEMCINRECAKESVIVSIINWLCIYYSTVLEREVSISQTKKLLWAQIAFVVMILPVDASLAFRTIGVALFAHALYLCKKAF